MVNPAAGRKLNPLTSLRFIAAAMIVLIHAARPFGIPLGSEWLTRLTNGVSFFFVLSGFILVYVYSSRDRLEKRRFLLARVARIWPAHCSALVLFLLLTHDWHGFSLGALLANLTMVHAWIPVHSYYVSFVGPSWSISTEFGFYLCFLLLVKNWQQTWLMKLLASLVLLAAMIAVANLLEKYVTPPAKTSWAIALMYFNPLGRLFEFVLGMSTAAFWRRYSLGSRRGVLLGTVMEVGALSLVLVVLTYADRWARVAGLQWWMGKPGEIWLARGGCCCGAFAVLIFVFALEQGFLSRLLSLSFPVLLGELSYSLYLIHQVFLSYYENHARYFAPAPRMVNLGIFCVAMLSIAYLIWTFIERPFRRKILGWWPTPSLAAAVELPASMIASSGVPIKASHPEIVLPSRRGTRVALALLVLALLPTFGMLLFAPGFEKIPLARADEIAQAGRPEVRGITFGDSLVLIGVRNQISDSGDVELEMAWKALGEQPLDAEVTVRATDAKGRTLAKKTYRQDPRSGRVPINTTWRETVLLSRAAVDHAALVTLGVMRKKKPLVPDRGPLDSEKRRLILKLSDVALHE